MKSARAFATALVTTPNLKVARQLTRALLTARLAACVNLVPRLESHYWWQGKAASSQEVLLIIKTTRARLPALEKRVLDLHPYETPEFIVLAVDRGATRYLDWIASSVRSG